VYTKRPEGFEQGENLVYLNKALYGLKQALRLWNRSALLRWGIRQLYSDNCIFIYDDYGIVITVYVDVLLIFNTELAKIDEIKGLLAKEFEMKDMGELRYFLGI
jgi:Reverse transcriptase (RNA-dependent DNA polymerase)